MVRASRNPGVSQAETYKKAWSMWRKAIVLLLLKVHPSPREKELGFAQTLSSKSRPGTLRPVLCGQ